MLRNPHFELNEDLIDLSDDITSTAAINRILAQAIDMGASDIHIEPLPHEFIVRFRVDGMLRVVASHDLDNYNSLMARIKVMANLDSTGPSRIQESETQIEYDNRMVSFRVSIFPTAHGDTAIFRILENLNIFDNLAGIGFENDQIEKMQTAINHNSGMILVTGPTGHGKTTTLFSLLNILNSPEKCIVTLEDPIEYKIPLVRQTEIDPDQGLTFANGLRSMLRQDPEIIMVGEIRDKETAQIAIESALTGHLVLSTIHTTNAPGAIARLINMGIEPYLITSVIRVITAQRLVRKLCLHCREQFVPAKSLIEELSLNADKTFYRAQGCKECNYKGYRGRMAIHEVLVLNRQIEDLIMQKANEDELYDQAITNGMVSLRTQALEKAGEGIISLEEVLRVTESIL